MGNNNTTFKQELMIAFETYLYIYFTKRDYQETIAWLHPQVTIIGTGRDEIALSYEEGCIIFARDLIQCPEPITYERIFSTVTEVTKDTGIVIAQMNLQGSINDMPFTINNLRMSIVLVKRESLWQIIHYHLSQEQANLEEGESFPLQEVEEKNQLLEQMINKRTLELTEALRKVEIAANIDDLTGVYNRRKFDDVFLYELERAKRFDKSLSIILGDVDHFKKVNDKHGHLVGDEVLKTISKLLRQSIRQVDMLARWGGEEFIILLPETPGREGMKMAEKLRDLIEKSENKYQIQLSISFGVAEYLPSDDRDSLLKRADIALYRAKAGGRNRVEMCTAIA